MSGQCGNCEWWWIDPDNEFGECQLTATWAGDRIGDEPTMAWANGSRQCVLMTSAEFGCVQWRAVARED